MAGHSKWANIQHRKGAQDKKRGKIFTRLIREITTAARMGDPDPVNNPRLRLAIDKGLAANMPKDNIERAIKRGSGETDGGTFEEIRYEGYGPGGAAVLVDCLTDNRNRTASEVRHAFSKFGGNLGTDGSVAFLFTRTGVVNYEPGADEDAIMEVALDAGADDIVTNDDGSIDVIVAPDEFDSVVTALDEAGLESADADIIQKASTASELDQKSAESMMKMVDMMEELDDVQEVHSNAEFPEDFKPA